jgi:hypothetical protein
MNLKADLGLAICLSLGASGMAGSFSCGASALSPELISEERQDAARASGQKLEYLGKVIAV